MKFNGSLSKTFPSAEHIYWQLVGKPVKDGTGKQIGTITEVDEEHDIFYMDISDEEFSKIILDNKGVKRMSISFVGFEKIT